MQKFFKKHPYILVFGIFQIFFSAPGQTFLISLVVTPIFNELNISLSHFAGIYSAATLSAALLLNPAGRLIDRYETQVIIKAISFFMAIGCWLLAGAQNIVMLFFGFFIVRLIGQGVFSLTASTLMVKQFHKNRGKAMGLITLGFPLSEAIYPSILVLLLSLVGWRVSYLIFGLSNIVLMLPLQLYLLHKSKIIHGEFLPGELRFNPQNLPADDDGRKVRPHKDFTVSQVVKDFKFYLILMSSCLPPMIVTGLLFHQESLFDSNGWPISLAATGLMIYAFTKAFGSLWIGPIIDKYGPLYPFMGLIILMGVGTFLAGLGGPFWVLVLYFALIGFALGFSSPVSSVVWPYFYGAKHMGSIKGLVATFRNGLTALGPLPMAMAIDAGLSINMILKFTALAIIILSCLPYIVFLCDRKS